MAKVPLATKCNRLSWHISLSQLDQFSSKQNRNDTVRHPCTKCSTSSYQIW